MNSETAPEIGFGKTVDLPFAAAVEKAEKTLKEEGFGVLTRIDVKATLKEKLDLDRDPFVILGACNPPFAHRALELDPRVGMLMPCNVVVRQDGDRVRVEAMNPELMATMLPGSGLEPVAREVTERLRRVIAAI